MQCADQSIKNPLFEVENVINQRVETGRSGCHFRIAHKLIAVYTYTFSVEDRITKLMFCSNKSFLSLFLKLSIWLLIISSENFWRKRFSYTIPFAPWIPCSSIWPYEQLEVSKACAVLSHVWSCASQYFKKQLF